MKSRVAFTVLGLSAMLLAGCGSGLTIVQPTVLAPNELYLKYDNEFQVHSPEGEVATGYRYRGLSDYVGCVPQAAHHALEAESAGDTAIGLTVAGIGLGVGGMAGLAGLAYENKREVMAGFLLAGLGAEILGLVLTAVGRTYKVDANGHAVDAVNYYNDEVGSRGGRCGPQGAEIPDPPPRAAPPAKNGAIMPVPVDQIPPPPPIKPWPVQTQPQPPDRILLPQ